MNQKNLIELVKTSDGATLGLVIRINVNDLFFLDPNATHVRVVSHPTQNGINLEITGAGNSMKKEEGGGWQTSKDEKVPNNGMDATGYKSFPLSENAAAAVLRWMLGRGR